MDGRDESKRILERVERENAGVLSSAAMRAADHFSAKDADAADKAEVWARRIGRALSLIGCLVLIGLLWLQLSNR